MSLPITLRASPDEVYNFSLLISKASMRYAISRYSYQKPWRSEQLPITHIKSPDELQDFPLLLSSPHEVHNFSLLLSRPDEVNLFLLLLLRISRSAPPLQFAHRYLRKHSYPSIHYLIMIIHQSTITWLFACMINTHKHIKASSSHVSHHIDIMQSLSLYLT